MCQVEFYLGKDVSISPNWNLVNSMMVIIPVFLLHHWSSTSG
jgi:hypothetical protein